MYILAKTFLLVFLSILMLSILDDLDASRVSESEGEKEDEQILVLNMNCCVHHFHFVHLRMNIEALEHRRKNGRRSNYVRHSDISYLPLSTRRSFSYSFFFMSILYLVSLFRSCGIPHLFSILATYGCYLE